MRIGFRFDKLDGVVRDSPILDGLFGTISWVRLFNESLRLSGEIKPTERVDRFVIDASGVGFSVVALGEPSPAPAAPERGNAVLCRGSWMLGTACGKCAKCTEEAPRAIGTLRANCEAVNKRIKMITSLIPPPATTTTAGYDLVDNAKLNLFDALRAQLYDEKGALR